MIRLSLVVVMLGLFSSQSLWAAEGRCLDEVLSATGKPSSIGELARANAFFTWKSMAKEKFGADYNAWSSATERKLVCVDLMDGENKGKWECTRTARPCQKGASLQVEKEAGQCKELVVSAYGRRRGTAAQAKAEAIHGWFLTTRDQLGEAWADWEKAKTRSTDCRRKSKWQYQCIAQAYPCEG